MTKVDLIVAGAITNEVIITTSQPTTPPPALTPDVGLVEIENITTGAVWMTGPVPPDVPGHVPGDMWLAEDGSVWTWDGFVWTNTGINISSSDTPEEVLAKILTVDGTGSGLDADLLDGQHATYFATDADMTTAEADIDALESRVTSTESVNAAQTTAINANTAKNTAQDGRLDAVESKNTAQDNAIALKANIDSPTFTGDPKAPTPATNDNDTSIATTAFVKTVAASINPFPEAPSDSNAYGRKAGAWVDVTEEAPNDGVSYGRKNGAWAASVGGATISDTPPAPPLVNGQLWWESDTGNTFVWVIDAGGGAGQWVQLAGQGFASVWVGDLPPANPAPTMLWFRTDKGRLYIYLDDGNSLQWVDTSGAVSVPVKTALPRNHVTNGGMQVAQETANAVAPGSIYPVDQFVLGGSIATVTASWQPNSGPEALEALGTSLSTAKPTLAAGDNWQLYQPIEGLMVEDFLWGSPKAKPVVARFWAFATVTGTFTFRIANAAATRQFSAPFNTVANTYKEIVIPIPGDLLGAWPKTAAVGLYMYWGLAAGSTYATGVPGWQAGGANAPVQIAGQTNLAAVAGGAFYLANVGLYLDPDGTGLAPPWETPRYDEELLRCMRYWEKGNFTMVGPTLSYLNGFYKAIKRVTPTMTASPGQGSGGAFAAQGSDSFYQNVANSVTWGATWTATARM